MCGIFGLSCSSYPDRELLGHLLQDLFILSESRGKEASGFVFRDSEEIGFGKTPFAASELVRSHSYQEALNKFLSKKTPYFSAIGHSRLVTNGYEHESCNNQPIIKRNVLAVHNGIIVNHRAIWNDFFDDEPSSSLDSEVIPALISRSLTNGLSVASALKSLFDKIQGMTSTALLFSDIPYLVLATNNGSLYKVRHPEDAFTLFASERYFLNALIEKHPGCGLLQQDVQQLPANTFTVINLGDQSQYDSRIFEAEDSALSEPVSEILPIAEVPIRLTKPVAVNRSMEHDLQRVPANILKEVSEKKAAIKSLKRCVRCILPETFPFISFDRAGICNYCEGYRPLRFEGADAFRMLMEKYKSTSKNTHDCLVPFSGGRDSSYALHFVTKELGFKPLAFSYDWGMLTDLARRNQSRMCGALGVEHILISADIRSKRKNINRNVTAWLKRPRLGTIPLFMAGDKQYFYFANLLMKQNRLGLSIMGENMLETTKFKTGFCGIKPRFDAEKTYSLSAVDKLKMLAYYGKEYLANPSYINRSLLDTLDAFKSYYVMKHDNINIFNYLPWHEESLMEVLLNNYDWEIDPETTSTWRIGDGTAAFYNYIYYLVAGFTENDTFRSNQIREGLITRDDALSKIDTENAPRWASIQWYCNVIGIDWLDAISIINNIRPLYYPFLEKADWKQMSAESA